MVEIGKIEKVNLRDIWKNEERDFTPWLEKNIEILSEHIGIGIEDLRKEASIGTFSADLVGTSHETDDKVVVIENQFGDTNHDHLGKLITYISGKQAKIGIWIAEKFREEHIAALEYLNENEKENGISFFGVEICLKKIGNSPPAPEFDIIVKPNLWQRRISQESLSPNDIKRRELRLEFFTKLVNRYREINPSWNRVTPQPQHWLSFGAGKAGFGFGWTWKSSGGWAFSTELYIDVKDAEENKRLFESLKLNRENIEREMGFKLNWQELPDSRACRIEYSIPTGVPFTKLTEERKSELTEWGATHMKIFSEVLRKYIQKLE